MTVNDYKLVCPTSAMINGRTGAICDKCFVGKYWHVAADRCHDDSLAGSSLLAVEMTLHHRMLRVFERHVRLFFAESEFRRRTLIRRRHRPGRIPACHAAVRHGRLPGAALRGRADRPRPVLRSARRGQGRRRSHRGGGDRTGRSRHRRARRGRAPPPKPSGTVGTRPDRLPRPALRRGPRRADPSRRCDRPAESTDGGDAVRRPPELRLGPAVIATAVGSYRTSSATARRACWCRPVTSRRSPGRCGDSWTRPAWPVASARSPGPTSSSATRRMRATRRRWRPTRRPASRRRGRTRAPRIDA